MLTAFTMKELGTNCCFCCTNNRYRGVHFFFDVHSFLIKFNEYFAWGPLFPQMNSCFFTCETCDVSKPYKCATSLYRVFRNDSEILQDTIQPNQTHRKGHVPIAFPFSSGYHFFTRAFLNKNGLISFTDISINELILD